MARDVFISYKREERAQVERIAERLRGLGLDVWFDTKLASGMSFDEEINREVRAAKCVLVCWTPAAIESDWVRAEASIGKGRDALAAVFLKPTELYPPFNLIHTEDLSDWGGEDLHRGWLNTLARIGALTERPDIAERARRFSASLEVPAPPPPRTPAARAPAVEEPPPSAKSPLPVIVAALVGLVALGGGAFWFFGRSPAPSEASTCLAIPAFGADDLAGHAAALRDAMATDSPGCGHEAALATLETRAWGDASAQNSVAAYEAFLAAFPVAGAPKPTYAESAAKRLAEMTAPGDATGPAIPTPPPGELSLAPATPPVVKAPVEAPAPPPAAPTPADCARAAMAQKLDGVSAERMCAGATSLEPARCFEWIMGGTVSWGSSTQWQPSNAARLCTGATSARARVNCFEKELAAIKAWDAAINRCTSGRALDKAVLTPPDLTDAIKRARESSAAAPALRMISRGEARIRQTWTYDFDAQKEGGEGADIWFQAKTATDRGISPARGAKITRLTDQRLDAVRCQQAEFQGDYLPIDASTRANFCVRTTEGAIALVRIEEGPGPSPGQLVVSFALWR